MTMVAINAGLNGDEEEGVVVAADTIAMSAGSPRFVTDMVQQKNWSKPKLIVEPQKRPPFLKVRKNWLIQKLIVQAHPVKSAMAALQAHQVRSAMALWQIWLDKAATPRSNNSQGLIQRKAKMPKGHLGGAGRGGGVRNVKDRKMSKG